jgi:hypothetical protein
MEVQQLLGSGYFGQGASFFGVSGVGLVLLDLIPGANSLE